MVSNEVSFSVATIADARLLAAQMRECDRIEVLASGAKSVESAVIQSVQMSLQAYSFWCDGDLVCIAGVSSKSLLGGVGVPWALGTGLMDRMPRQVLHYSPRMLAVMMGEFAELVNYVHAENRRSIRWLKWLGFTVDPAQQLKNGEWFCRFSIGGL